MDECAYDASWRQPSASAARQVVQADPDDSGLEHSLISHSDIDEAVSDFMGSSQSFTGDQSMESDSDAATHGSDSEVEGSGSDASSGDFTSEGEYSTDAPATSESSMSTHSSSPVPPSRPNSPFDSMDHLEPHRFNFVRSPFPVAVKRKRRACSTERTATSSLDEFDCMKRRRMEVSELAFDLDFMMLSSSDHSRDMETNKDLKPALSSRGPDTQGVQYQQRAPRPRKRVRFSSDERVAPPPSYELMNLDEDARLEMHPIDEWAAQHQAGADHSSTSSDSANNEVVQDDQNAPINQEKGASETTKEQERSEKLLSLIRPVKKEVSVPLGQGEGVYAQQARSTVARSRSLTQTLQSSPIAVVQQSDATQTDDVSDSECSIGLLDNLFGKHLQRLFEHLDQVEDGETGDVLQHILKDAISNSNVVISGKGVLKRYQQLLQIIIRERERSAKLDEQIKASKKVGQDRLLDRSKFFDNIRQRENAVHLLKQKKEQLEKALAHIKKLQEELSQRDEEVKEMAEKRTKTEEELDRLDNANAKLKEALKESRGAHSVWEDKCKCLEKTVHELQNNLLQQVMKNMQAAEDAHLTPQSVYSPCPVVTPFHDSKRAALQVSARPKRSRKSAEIFLSSSSGSSGDNCAKSPDVFPKAEAFQTQSGAVRVKSSAEEQSNDTHGLTVQVSCLTEQLVAERQFREKETDRLQRTLKELREAKRRILDLEEMLENAERSAQSQLTEKDQLLQNLNLADRNAALRASSTIEELKTRNEKLHAQLQMERSKAASIQDELDHLKRRRRSDSDRAMRDLDEHEDEQDRDADPRRVRSMSRNRGSNKRCRIPDPGPVAVVPPEETFNGLFPSTPYRHAAPLASLDEPAPFDGSISPQSPSSSSSRSDSDEAEETPHSVRQDRSRSNSQGGRLPHAPPRSYAEYREDKPMVSSDSPEQRPSDGVEKKKNHRKTKKKSRQEDGKWAHSSSSSSSGSSSDCDSDIQIVEETIVTRKRQGGKRVKLKR